ncbi:MAG: FecR domain-containing protein, partial [Acidobacteria bacterium]|nr:FecR domain-containing protein [Acidobacteriota bacterium]
MTEDHHSEEHKEKHHGVEVYWTTVTYRTVILLVLAVVLGILAIIFALNPGAFASLQKKFSEAMSGGNNTPVAPVVSQVRFVALDGKVELKKVNSVKWVPADQSTTLSKGDLIQTGGDAVARILFPDGSIYTVKADTLITVEENSMTQDRSTRVGVHITSGKVDLATSTFEGPNSAAELSFENARASVQENSRVAVRSDPENKKHEITV